MVVGAVHHVRGVDEVVAGAFHAQLDFGVAQDYFASADGDEGYIGAEKGARGLLGGLPGVDAHGREVQLVFGLKQQRLGADLHDGRRLHGRGDSKERQLRVDQRAVVRHPVLAVDEFQAPAEVQRLRGRDESRL